jgi:hypothetical protein
MMRNSDKRVRVGALICFLCLVLTSCGYHLSGKAVGVPSSIDSIAIPIFVNHSVKYRLEQRLTAAVVDEFLAKTKYRITSEPALAQALLSGEVAEFSSTPVIFAGGAGSTFLVTVRMRVELRDLKTRKILFENRNFVFREEFEISRQSVDFFPEEGPALDRLSREFSRSLVSTILESF